MVPPIEVGVLSPGSETTTTGTTGTMGNAEVRFAALLALLVEWQATTPGTREAAEVPETTPALPVRVTRTKLCEKRI